MSIAPRDQPTPVPQNRLHAVLSAGLGPQWQLVKAIQNKSVPGVVEAIRQGASPNATDASNKSMFVLVVESAASEADTDVRLAMLGALIEAGGRPTLDDKKTIFSHVFYHDLDASRGSWTVDTTVVRRRLVKMRGVVPELMDDDLIKIALVESWDPLREDGSKDYILWAATDYSVEALGPDTSEDLKMQVLQRAISRAGDIQEQRLSKIRFFPNDALNWAFRVHSSPEVVKLLVRFLDEQSVVWSGLLFGSWVAHNYTQGNVLAPTRSIGGPNMNYLYTPFADLYARAPVVKKLSVYEGWCRGGPAEPGTGTATTRMVGQRVIQCYKPQHAPQPLSLTIDYEVWNDLKTAVTLFQDVSFVGPFSWFYYKTAFLRGEGIMTPSQSSKRVDGLVLYDNGFVEFDPQFQWNVCAPNAGPRATVMICTDDGKIKKAYVWEQHWLKMRAAGMNIKSDHLSCFWA